MNARLLHADRPVHAEAARRRVELGVHADDHVALLEPQPEQRLQAVRPDAEVRAEVHERPPQLDRPVDRVVQLEGGLAGERQAHDVARDAGDVGVDVAEEARRVGEAGAPQQLPGERPRDVDRGEGHRPVQDVDAEAPGLDPVADPHLGVGRAAGREGQDEPRLGLAQDHPVVHDVAALVEQQRVARAAGLDVRDVARVEPLQRLDDIRSGHDELAERATRRRARRPRGRPSTRRRRRRSATAATSRRTGPSGPRARGARRGAASVGRRRSYVSAAASASVIWRDAGRAVNGAGTSPVRAAIHDADVGQAGAALARCRGRPGWRA